MGLVSGADFVLHHAMQLGLLGFVVLIPCDCLKDNCAIFKFRDWYFTKIKNKNIS